MAAVLPASPSVPVRQRAHWVDRMAHLALAVVAVLLIAFLALPLLSILLQALQGRGWRVRLAPELHRLRQDAGVAGKPVEQRLGVCLGHGDQRAAGVCVCLCAGALVHALQVAVSRHHADPAPGTVAAVGHFADLLVWQPGRAQSVDAGAGNRPDLRRARHRDRRMFRRVSARVDDSGHRTQPVRCAPLRGRRRHGHIRRAQVFHHHAAGRQVRPDLCRVGHIHAGHDRLWHSQGDRGQLQCAGHRCVQAGDRPAGLRPRARWWRSSCWHRRSSPLRSTST